MYKFNSIASVVREYRTKEGLSQSELSKKVGYKNGQFISNAERGLCTIPTKKLRRISVAINCPLELLIDSKQTDNLINIMSNLGE